MDGLLASLTAKYGGKAVKTRAADEPSEQDFAAAAARVAKRRKQK